MSSLSYPWEIELPLKSERISEMTDFMLDSTPSTGFICVPAREQLKKDLQMALSERRMPLIQLRGPEDVQADLNAIFTALQGLIRGRFQSLVFIGHQNPVMPSDFDPNDIAHHAIPYRMTWDFYSQIFAVGLFTCGLQDFKQNLTLAESCAKLFMDPSEIDLYTQKGQPRAKGKALNLTAVFPTYPTKPLPHSRYSPIAAYSLLPETETDKVRATMVFDVQAAAMVRAMTQARLRRELVFSNATFPYVIPNDVRFALPFYQQLYNFLGEKYEFESITYRQVLEVTHEVFGQFITWITENPENNQGSVSEDVIFEKIDPILTSRGIPYKRKIS